MWDRGDIWNLFALVTDSPRTFRPSSTFLQPGVCKPHPSSFVGRLCSSELSLLVRHWVICGVFAIVVCCRKGRTPWGLLPWNAEFLSGWRGQIILIKSFPIPGTWTGWCEKRAGPQTDFPLWRHMNRCCRKPAAVKPKLEARGPGLLSPTRAEFPFYLHRDQRQRFI